MLDWQDSYGIGVESIDNAHRELFHIINKLHKAVCMGNPNAKWTAAQAIKYVHNYTLKHFQDEEAYMRSIGFTGYEAHEAVHSVMRERIIPRLEAYLVRENYSAQSIELFLTILGKWLSRHIVGHDREIVQKAVPEAEGAAAGEAAGGEGQKKGVSSGQPAVGSDEAAASPAVRGGRRSLLWLVMIVLVFGVAYGAGGILVKSRMDRITELKSSIQAREAALTELEAAIKEEQAALAELRSETWGLRLTTFPDGTRGIILPKNMIYEWHGKMESGEYADFEGIVVRSAVDGRMPLNRPENAGEESALSSD